MIRRTLYRLAAACITLLTLVCVIPPQPTEARADTVWNAVFFNNTTLSGNGVHYTTYPNLNFNWDVNSPVPGTVNVNNWSARFTSTRTFAKGTMYEFTANSDDGVRVYIDGVLALDKFVVRSATTDVFYWMLPAGDHTMVVEYFKSTGQGRLRFTWGVTRTSISGTVYEADHVVPLPGAQVRLFDTVYAETYGPFTADATGKYAGTVSAGWYTVWASAPGHVDEYASGKPSVAWADTVYIPPTSPVTNVNFSLDLPGSISGIVWDADGTNPIGGAKVEAFGYDYLGSYVGSMASMITPSTGLYSLSLPPGRYRIVASAGGFVTEFWYEQTSIQGATELVLNSGHNIGGVNFTLALMATVSGKVTKVDGTTPIGGATVSAYGYGYLGSYAGALASTTTQPDGTYTMQVPPGNLRFGATAPNHFGEFYLEQPIIDTAQELTLTAASNVGNINFTLAAYATLSASLTLQGYQPPPSSSWSQPVHVIITSDGAATPEFDGWMDSDENGEFILSPLNPGDYRIWVKTHTTLANVITQNLPGGESHALIGLLRQGDATDDNAVTIADFSVLASTFNKELGVAGYDARADFNGDNVVSIADFSLLSSNYGQSGAAP